jgi:Domain of unknown function (DUF1883)
VQQQFLKFSLGHLSSGAVVEVVMDGVESDVYLADSSNVSKLERGDLSGFRGYGGHYNQSPVRLQAPSAGLWNAVVIPSGGTVRASASVVSPV